MSTPSLNTEKLGAIPDVPGDLSAAAHELLVAIKRNLELLAGQGSALNKALTVGDLYSRGLASITIDGVTYTPDVIASDTDNVAPIGAAVIVRPPTPDNVLVFSALGSLWLSWTAARYAGHLHTEIWRAETNDVGDAVLIDVATTSFYQDAFGLTGETRYYWIRHINRLGAPGSYHAGATAGSTATSGTVDTPDLTADAVTAEKIFVAELAAISAAMGTLTAGKLESSDGTFTIDLDNKQVLIAGPLGQAADDYLILQTGVLEMYKWTGATHLLYKALRHRESGIAESGTTVAIPGYFESQPSVIVSPRDIKLYDATYSNQDQSIQFLAENFVEFATGQWQFDAKAQLSLAQNTGNEILADGSGDTASNSWTSSTYTTPSNSTSVIVYVTVNSKRGTGTAPNWYYRKVDWKIWYRVSPAGGWLSTTNQTVAMGAQFGAISDNRLLTFPATDTYDIYVEYTAADVGGTFSDGGSQYSYVTAYRYSDGQETAENTYHVVGCANNVRTYTADCDFGAYSPPAGYAVYNVNYSFKGRYTRWAKITWTAACVTNYAEATVTFPDGYTLQALLNESIGESGSLSYLTTGTRSFSQGSYSQVIQATAYTRAQGGNTLYRYAEATSRARIYNGVATIQSRKLNVNSATPVNNYSFDSYDWEVSASQTLATGKLSWIAVGE